MNKTVIFNVIEYGDICKIALPSEYVPTDYERFIVSNENNNAIVKVDRNILGLLFASFLLLTGLSGVYYKVKGI